MALNSRQLVSCGRRIKRSIASVPIEDNEALIVDQLIGATQLGRRSRIADGPCANTRNGRGRTIMAFRISSMRQRADRTVGDSIARSRGAVHSIAEQGVVEQRLRDDVRMKLVANPNVEAGRAGPLSRASDPETNFGGCFVLSRIPLRFPISGVRVLLHEVPHIAFSHAVKYEWSK